MTRARHNLNGPKSGFTTLEMLLAMAVLGIILTIAAAFLQTNQRATDAQQARTTTLEDARLAASRIAETINQAAYIYPAGSRIQVNDGLVGTDGKNTVMTGRNALVLLVPEGSSGIPEYRGVIFYLAARTTFLDVLPALSSDRIAQSVLVEARSSTTIPWAKNQSNPPSSTWNVKMDEGVLIDGMVESSVSDCSKPGSTGSVLMCDGASFSPSAGIDSTAFSGGLRANTTDMGNPRALLLGVGFKLAIRVSPAGQTATTAPTTTITSLGTARNVPRR
jgi:prepilin-type N-terminal cleavage/methylation domain-containing protein